MRRVYAIDATTPALPLICAQAKRPPEDAVADAVVTHVARDRRRYALRLGDYLALEPEPFFGAAGAAAPFGRV